MKSIAFVDLEVNSSGTVGDYGCITNNDATFHARSSEGLRRFLIGSEFICGHNFLQHDVRYMDNIISQCNIDSHHFIDTLYLSPLLFPRRPYHSLLKDEKLLTDELNNPLNDSIKARDLFFDEVTAFNKLEEPLKRILFLLLNEHSEFIGFFKYLGYKTEDDVLKLIQKTFSQDICTHADLPKMISEYPVELAYCLTNIHTQDQFSILPPWVLRNYPNTERLMRLLCDQPCLTGCDYCNKALDPVRHLKYFFGYDSFRKFGGQPLQEMAVRDALLGKSILAIFPTGGGKSITFQIPALISGKNVKGLTVIISPLQSLMKDQVDNMDRSGISEAATINGSLDPLQRAEAIDRVREGLVSILYISPELLRSRTIERLLLERRITRFVIDEAHCFSAWGQDFRVDYLFIAKFIKTLEEKKNLSDPIPVSCFTATAKQSVIDDIRSYFKRELNLDLVMHQTSVPRTNLHYKVIVKNSESEKYQELRRIIDIKHCPTIIYVSKTKTAEMLADKLTRDGFPAKAYHGQMDNRIKTENQNDFLSGDIPIIVATSAFGMGVDKKDVGLVIHFQISDSLEQYLQEAGRAGRDTDITADCYILYNDSDLDSHFIMHNQTRISIKEIQQVWQAIKNLTKYRLTVSQSALEIARQAGWDDTIDTIETRVKAAIATLEDAGYLDRLQNSPRVFADSILCRTAKEADAIISKSDELSEEEKKNAIRIMKNLIGNRSRSKAADNAGETRVDYLADILGLSREQVIGVLNLLRQIGLLADSKDLVVYLPNDSNESRLSQSLITFCSIERQLIGLLHDEEETYNLKQLNEDMENQGCKNCSVVKIQTILRYLQKKDWLSFRYTDTSKNHVRLKIRKSKLQMTNQLDQRLELARFIISYLARLHDYRTNKDIQTESIINFSVLEVLTAYNNTPQLEKIEFTISDVEDALLYLSHIETLSIEGGFMVLYSPMTIRRLEENPRRRFRKEDYQKLELHYNIKMEQIHIVGEYAKRMINDYKDALKFVDDYFHMNYSAFLDRYFKGGRREEISCNITPQKFRELFSELSPTQLSIIKDQDSKNIAVLAGPGSGKTRILVHKLASLILMEDIKTEQLLMLTFSRAAATEFKTRLIKLINKAAHFVDIKTFHSYCFDLLGKVGNLDKSDQIIADAIDKIKSGEIEPSHITKTVLVIDEAQDMSEKEYQLIDILMQMNEDMRVIAVGDDDQNIYEFRGSSSKYLAQFINEHQTKTYELLTNYRSKGNLVDFANQFATHISGRMKKMPITPNNKDNGVIRILNYNNVSGNNMLTPFVEDLASSARTGTTCALVNTNNQALQIAGMLQTRGLPAKLIQTNENFRLSDLAELRFFIKHFITDNETITIDNDDWKAACQSLRNKYIRSSILDNCMKLIKCFETLFPGTKYTTDLISYVRESKLEDFTIGEIDTIYVGTIHKSKGKEFDNVHILLDKNQMISSTAESNRVLYVGFTRAKTNLVIHTNSHYLDFIKTENMDCLTDSNFYPLPSDITRQANHKAVWLDYFIDRQRQHWLDDLQSGDQLFYKNNGCQNSRGQLILKFSSQWRDEIKKMDALGYVPKHVSVGFILHWKKEGTDNEYKIILPEIHYVKSNHTTVLRVSEKQSEDDAYSFPDNSI